MGKIVSYDPYDKKFTFHEESRWEDTVWAVFYSNNLNPRSKVIFATILLHVRETPLVFPSQKELAAAAHISTRTVRRHLNQLQEFNLISIPEKCGRYNKYSINEFKDADLKFSEQAGTYLKTLLNVKVPVLSLTPDKSDMKNMTPDKNVRYQQKKEKKDREKEKEEKKVIQRKEEREKEKEKRERKCTVSNRLDLPESGIHSHLDKKELRMASLRKRKEKKNKSKELFKKNKESKRGIKKKVEPNVLEWKTRDVEGYFYNKYLEEYREVMPLDFVVNRTCIKRFLKKGADRQEIKDVIDFAFDNWEELRDKLKLDTTPRPTIGFVFSGYFETLANLQRAGFSSHGLKDTRSDFEFDLDLRDKEYK